MQRVSQFGSSRKFIDILAVLLMLSFTNAFLAPAVSAFMADVVPRDIRGRVMAAFGRGSIMITPD
jgi:MFS family permease